MSTLKREQHVDLALDRVSRDLVRLGEAYQADDTEAAERITSRIVVTLSELYAEGCGTGKRFPDCRVSDIGDE